ncbi:hypothetical protein [Sorangium sp. So ce1000]|uniref:hypothetical protein n=1 Tax=Sorangium sp. So ce1000 TaxID=3133325 RepID=UPI003F60996D
MKDLFALRRGSRYSIEAAVNHQHRDTSSMNNEHGERMGELSRLVELVLDVAKSALEEQGTFLPGSIAVDAAGKYAIGVAPHGGVDGWTLLTTAFRQRAAAEELRAVALYRDVRVRERGASEDVDAIHAVVELASGEAVQVFQIYRKNDAGEIVYDRPAIEQAPSVIFAKSP